MTVPSESEEPTAPVSESVGTPEEEIVDNSAPAIANIDSSEEEEWI